jgi:tetratricopeptide (TPR) repeat protein
MAMVLMLLCTDAIGKIDDADIAALARNYEQRLAVKDIDGAAHCVSMSRLADLSLDGVRASDKFIGSFRASMTQARFEAIVRNLISNLGPTGGVKFLRVVQRPAGPRALFRIVSDAGVNYQEYVPEVVDGQLKFVDIYVWMLGEKMSEVYGRLAEQGAIAEAAGQDGPPKFVQISTRMSQAVNAREFGEALRLYDLLTPEQQQTKMIQSLRVRSLLATDDRAYESALKDYANLFVGDATIHLILLDSYRDKKQHDRALKAIDQVDHALGGDPYLDVLRSSVQFDAGQTDDAIDSARRALDREPRLLRAADLLVTYALLREDFPAAKDVMLKMEQDMDFNFGDLTQNQVFAAFVKSPAYREFLEQRPTQTSSTR